MARDKAKDDRMFNCNQEHEHSQVASHYGANTEKVLKFLKDSCARDDIYRFTHAQVGSFLANAHVMIFYRIY